MEEAVSTTNLEVPQEPGNVTPAPKAGRKMLMLFSVVLIFAVILLAAGSYVYLISKNKSATPVYTQAVPTQEPTQSPSPTGITTISKSSDLDSALKEVNNTSESDLQNDLSQATS